ncbi:MAG: type I DNA topoisomerase [Candidatus Alcyoniella australis]|nr:type I DNA topoisomerase [Candidatus Alcyoniella australis]
MTQSLIVVESPAKARTIGKVLGKGFIVLASKGHVKDLPKKTLGVDLENHFEPEYQTIHGRGKDLDAIKRAAKSADKIYLAPDPDREGEAIAWHIAQELPKGSEVYRVLFNEITRRGIKEGMSNPAELNSNKYDSHRARRVLDRLVGYQISPLLWKKVKYGLSAGRVQSVTLRLVVDREIEIEAFVSEEYWNVHVMLEAAQPPEFRAKLIKYQGEKLRIVDGVRAEQVRQYLESGSYRVDKVQQRESSRHAAPPFITSSLAQEAYRRFRFPARKTMSVAQRLYEGVQSGEGLITYMRTDSVRVAPEAITEVREHIGASFGPEFVPEKPNFFRSGKNAQEAHEAIRPTSLANTPESLRESLDANQLKLYALIYNRFVASQMAAARFLLTTADIVCGDYTLQSKGSVELFAGFLKLYQELRDNGDGDDRDNGDKLPPLAQDQSLDFRSIQAEQKFTQPPPRFTESTLIRELEQRGVGRPSTYASIISTIIDKEYVLRIKGSFSPTDLGRVVTELLIEAFPEVLDVAFTAQMEQSLDEIEDGRKQWRDLLVEFYGPFSERLSHADEAMANLKFKGRQIDVACDKCGAPMAIKFGRKGDYLACTAYPECSNTKNFKRDENGAIVELHDEATDLKCEKCQSPMLLREGRFGPYYACSNYPECRNTFSAKRKSAPEPAPDDVKCPDCEAAMLIRRSRVGNKFYSCSRFPKCKGTLPIPVQVPCPECGGELQEKRPKGRGKRFYGCANYPECEFTTPHRPLPGPCPVCGNALLAEKYDKDSDVVFCPNEGCEYVKPDETADETAKETADETAKETAKEQ